MGDRDYFVPSKLRELRGKVERAVQNGRVIVLGIGASFIAPDDPPVIYTDLARWKLQLRWRRKEIGNLGLDNATDRTETKYKYGFFVEWRAADRLKKTMLPELDFLLDTISAEKPKLISGVAFRRGVPR